MNKRLVFLGLLLAASPASLEAQNSIFGTQGLGFPGRVSGVRSLALGGGADLFDRGSTLNPALAVTFGQVTVGAVSGTTFREYTASGNVASGLQETRFPLAFLGGSMARFPFSWQLSFSTFAERSFDIVTSDTITVAGVDLPVEDRRTSEGGVVDLRAAIAWRASPVLAVGGAFHLLKGSSRVQATRKFDSDQFQPFLERGSLIYSGTSVSGGLLWLPRTTLSFAVTGRLNSSMGIRLRRVDATSMAMPASLAFGASVGITPQLRWMTTARWRSWSRAQADVAATGTSAFDTWEVGSGMEVSPGGQGGKFPLRIGVRYAQLPFSPTTDQPTEWNYSIGTGAPFAANRAVFDVALERFERDGAGASERGWYVTVGITLTPVR